MENSIKTTIKVTVDNYPIFLALACTAVSLVAYLICAFLRGDNPNSESGKPGRVSKSKSDPSSDGDDFGSGLANVARMAYIASVGCIAYISVYLMQQILSLKRYDIDYVYHNSGPKDEFIYRISSFWAGQQGSLLFWALCGALVGLFLVRKRNTFAPVTMAFWASIQLFFLVLLVVDDPFRPLVGYQAGVVGVGLKALLKNPWMAIHPPIVFLGYAALMVPAAFAIQGLIKRDLRDWASRSLPWAVLGWTALGAGLILGMVWSYEVLGWGGYWGWDPVENSSLIPWLTGTALVHGLILQRYRRRLAWSNVFLALSTFLLVIYATFLTRSGVLSDVSVHSFESLGTYGYLLGFLIFYAILCVAVVALAWKAAKRPTPGQMPELSKDFSAVLGVIAITVLAVAVLIGTSTPLVPKGSPALAQFTRFGSAIASRYTWISAILAIVSVVLIIMASLTAWSRKDKRAPVWRFDHTLWKSGSHIAHVGVLLMLIGMIGSGRGEDKQFALPEGGPAHSAMGYEFRFNKFESISDKTAALDITATRDGKIMQIPLHVEMTEQGPLWKPQVISSFARDLYISPGGMEQTTVTPELQFTDSQMISKPVNIPGTTSTLKLLGMQVEAHQATLEYQAPGQKPVQLIISEAQPAMIDGYELSFGGFSHGGDNHQMGSSAGVQVNISGNGIAERAVIKVSVKPLMSLVWTGTALIVLGGLLATWRRFREKRTQDDGILPDSV